MAITHDLLASLLDGDPHVTAGSSPNIVPKNKLLSVLLNAR